MTKTVGLSQTDVKMLEFVPFKDNTKPAGLLYAQSKAFYLTFRASFGNGYKTILGHDIPNLELLGPCLVNYHFAVELMLKGLISLKGQTFPFSHDLIELLELATPHYPDLAAIYNNLEEKYLLLEISKMGIRYAEGTISLRHNNKGNWQNKKPCQEFSEALDEIYEILKDIFDKNK